MADLEITYNGSKIVELSESGSKTLKTSGKYCEGDISVAYTKSSGGSTAWWREEGMEAIDTLDLTQEAIYVTTDNSIGYDSTQNINISAISFKGTGCQYKVDVGHITNGVFVVDTAKGTFNSGAEFLEYVPTESNKRFQLYRFMPNDNNHFTSIYFDRFNDLNYKLAIAERYLICPYVTSYGLTYRTDGRYGNCVNEYFDMPNWGVTFTSNGFFFHNPANLLRCEIKRLKNNMQLSRMFRDAVIIKEIIFHNDVVYTPNRLESMFYGCNNLQKITLPQIDFTNVSTISEMIYACKSLKSLDLSNFNLSNSCTSVSNMIYTAYDLISLKIGNQTSGQGLTSVRLGNYIYSLHYLDLSNWDLTALSGSASVVRFWENNSILYLKDFKIPTMHCSFDVAYANANYYTVDCLNDMFDRLPNLTNNEAYTITIGATNMAKLTAAELQVAYDKGWNVA